MEAGGGDRAMTRRTSLEGLQALIEHTMHHRSLWGMPALDAHT